jgi:hypothetical protein
VTAASGKDVTLASVANVKVGYVLYQTNSRYAIITAINGLVVTVDKTYSWQNGAAEVYTPIACALTWQPIHGGQVGVMKRHYSITVFWREIAGKYIIAIGNNFDLSSLETIIMPSFVGSLWGQGVYGQGNWGGEDQGAQTNRITVPYSKQRASYITIGLATAVPFTSFKLSGVSYTYDGVGPRFVENSK